MSDTPRTDAAEMLCFVQDVPETFLGFARELERESAALRADKERLDWLSEEDSWFDIPESGTFTPNTFRDAIDAAMKEAKP